MVVHESRKGKGLVQSKWNPKTFKKYLDWIQSTPQKNDTHLYYLDHTWINQYTFHWLLCTCTPFMRKWMHPSSFLSPDEVRGICFASSVHPFCQSVNTFCPSRAISQYLLVRVVNIFAEILYTDRGAMDIKHIKRELSLKARLWSPGWTSGVGQRQKLNFFEILSSCISN